MKLLQGGLSKYTTINNVRVTVGLRASPPFDVDVMVFEEDTNLILTVDKEMRYQEEHPIRLMTSLLEAKSHKPGSLVKNGNSWYAVVMDLDEKIMCQPPWVVEAYGRIFQSLESSKTQAVGIHLLGQQGKIPTEKAVELFLDGLKAQSSKYLRRIWLIVTEPSIESVRKEINTS